MTMQRSFWRSIPDGEVYAVMFDRPDGEHVEVLGICGPLHYSEVRVEDLDHFDYVLVADTFAGKYMSESHVYGPMREMTTNEILTLRGE